MAIKISNPLTRAVIDHIGEMVDYLKLHGYKKKDVALAIGTTDANLAGYRKYTKYIDHNTAEELRNKLVELYKDALVGFYRNDSPQNDASETGQLSTLAEIQTRQEAQFNVLMEVLSPFGISAEGVREMVAKEEDRIRARKNDSQ